MSQCHFKRSCHFNTNKYNININNCRITIYGRRKKDIIITYSYTVIPYRITLDNWIFSLITFYYLWDWHLEILDAKIFDKNMDFVKE